MKKVIPDCYLPDSAIGSYVSHEAVCVLNENKKDVTVNFTLYFEDRDKISGISVIVPAERTKHIRMDFLKTPDGQNLPKATPYAAVIECDDNIDIQYTRVDTTQAELAIATTIV